MLNQKEILLVSSLVSIQGFRQRSFFSSWLCWQNQIHFTLLLQTSLISLAVFFCVRGNLTVFFLPLRVVNQSGSFVSSLFAELICLFFVCLADFKGWVLALILGAVIVL